MGQGTESGGGYEYDYDPYEEGLETGTWLGRDGIEIRVSEMTPSRLRSVRQICYNKYLSSGFSDEAEKWDAWVNLCESELNSRKKISDNTSSSKSSPTAPRGRQIRMMCHCGQEYFARQSDLDRGWGFSCSKRCAAIRRKYNKAKGIKL